MKSDESDFNGARVSAQQKAPPSTGGALIADLDCAMRKLAYQYGAGILAATRSDSAARLERLKGSLLWPSEVKQFCDEDSFVLDPTAETNVAATMESAEGFAGAEIFVSDAAGSDTAAGTLAAQYETLQRAQNRFLLRRSAARSRSASRWSGARA